MEAKEHFVNPFTMAFVHISFQCSFAHIGACDCCPEHFGRMGKPQSEVAGHSTAHSQVHRDTLDLAIVDARHHAQPPTPQGLYDLLRPAQKDGIPRQKFEYGPVKRNAQAFRYIGRLCHNCRSMAVNPSFAWLTGNPHKT
jgi:hypothetical protein